MDVSKYRGPLRDPDTGLKIREPGGRAAASATVEALMYSLRERGTAGLDEAQTRRRLGELDEKQLHEISARLEKLPLHTPWKPEQIGKLVETWEKRHV